MTDVPSFPVFHPPDHESAGKVVERASSCSRCAKEFTQEQVNPAWVEGISDHSREAFLRSCEVDGGLIWLPARCPTCERKALEASAPIHVWENPAHVQD